MPNALRFIDSIASRIFNAPKGEFFITLGEARKRLVLSRHMEFRQLGRIPIAAQQAEFSWKSMHGKLALTPGREPNPHVIIVGSSGFGKSTLLKSMIIDIANAHLPAIIFDGHNEHESLVRGIGGHARNAAYSNINIFSLDGLSVGQRMESLTSLFSEVYGLGYIQRAQLNRVLYYTYRKFCTGMSDMRLESIPKLQDLLAELSVFISNSKSSGERNRLEHIRQRIGSLSKGMHITDYVALEELASGINSFSLAEIDGDEAKVVYISELARRLYTRMKANDTEKGIRLYVIIDESRFVIEKAGRIIGSLVSEGRKFGYAVIVVSNSALNIPKDVISNSSTFVAFHTNEPREIAYTSEVIGRGNPGKVYAVRSMLDTARQNCAVVVSYMNPDPVMVRTPDAQSIGQRTSKAAADGHEEGPKAVFLARKPVRLSEMIRMGIGGASLDEYTAGGESWLMRPHGSPGIEHEVSVRIISEYLKRNGVANRITSGRGPDIIAYANRRKIAVEYETGRKNLADTVKMIEGRGKEYDSTIVLVNDGRFKSYGRIATAGVSILKMSDLGSLAGIIGRQGR